MNELSPLEKQLRGWAPRRPSARLNERLFGQRVAERTPPFRHPWLAPAIGCALLLLVVSAQRNPGQAPGPAGDRGFFAMVLSNQGYAACLPGRPDQGQNAPRSDTFEWTNASGSTSSMGFLFRTKSND